MCLRRIFRNIESLPSPVVREQCLLAGFSLAYHSKFSNFPLEAIANSDLEGGENLRVQLDPFSGIEIALYPDPKFVNKDVLNMHRSRLSEFFIDMGKKELWKLDSVTVFEDARVALKEISPAHEAWLRVGFYLFRTTVCLGFDLFARDDGEAKGILGQADNRVSLVGFMGGLNDLKWSPDRNEKFFQEKIIPFLYDSGHRRWVFSEDMGVMSDLRFLAVDEDSRLEPPDAKSRFIAALKELVRSVPYIGPVLVVLIWGDKK